MYHGSGLHAGKKEKEPNFSPRQRLMSLTWGLLWNWNYAFDKPALGFPQR